MKSFDSWYTKLISDERWLELLRMYRTETIRKAGEKVFAQLVADSTVDVRPMNENRKHIYNILCKNPGDKVVFKNWAAKALETQEAEQKKEWVPVSEEERQRRLAEYKAIIDSMPIINNFPRLKPGEKEANGDWIASKGTPYPTTSKEEAYIRDRHFEYIKANFEARTGQKLPTWINEESWNIIYDENHLTDKGL